MGPIVKTDEQLKDLWTDCFCVYHGLSRESIKVEMCPKDIIFSRLLGFNSDIPQHVAYNLYWLEPKGTQCEQLVIYTITSMIHNSGDNPNRWTVNGLINACLKKRGLYDDIIAAIDARDSTKENQ